MTMNDAHRRSAAALLARTMREASALDALPGALTPASLADGYAIQSALGEALGEQVVGWKIAATSREGQQHIGVDAPLAGRLFASRTLHGGAHIPMAGNLMAVAECEFVFRLRADLPPRRSPYSRAEVSAAIGSLHPGLEFPNSRLRHFAAAGAPALAADNACAHLMVIGAATGADWREKYLAQHATTLSINGVVACRGCGADVLGHPLDALTWLANAHQVRGGSLRAGQYITTGVTGGPMPVRSGDRVRGDLGEFGHVDAVLLPAQ